MWSDVGGNKLTTTTRAQSEALEHYVCPPPKFTPNKRDAKVQYKKRPIQ